MVMPFKFGEGVPFVAIDPGVSACGVAFFMGEKLAACQYVRGMDRKCPLTRFEREKMLARAVKLWVRDKAPGAVHVVCEMPKAYAPGRMGRAVGADPNDLIRLAATVGALMISLAPMETWIVEPYQWKKRIPKPIVTMRVHERMDSVEREVLLAGLPSQASLHHNVYDAVGIGLAALGRLQWRLR